MSQADHDKNSEFSRRDFEEIALGGSIMAFPASFAATAADNFGGRR